MLLSERLYELLCRGPLTEVAEGDFSILVAANILVKSEEDELNAVLSENQEAIAGCDVLYQCIQPTAACNLACTYCGQEHELRTLSEHHQDLLIKRVADKLSAPRLKRLKVGWFGGEPLSAINVIRRMSPKLMDAAKANDCGYQSTIVTNGLALSRNTARELFEKCGVTEFEVTLDGPAAWHDQRRLTKKGHGSFDRIFSNLLEVSSDQAMTAGITIRCNVDTRNFEAVPDLIDKLAAHGLHSRLTLYFAPIHDWSNGAHLLSLSPREFADQEIAWFAHMRARGFSPALAPKRKHITCMAVNPASELADPFGNLFNCTEVSLVPAFGNPNIYALGDLENGSASSAPAARLANFYGSVGRGEFPCTDCEMLPVCGGSCPKQWIEGKATCPSAKMNLAERLPMMLIG